MASRLSHLSTANVDPTPIFFGEKLCSYTKINSGDGQGRKRCKLSTVFPGTSVFLSSIDFKQIIVILINKLLVQF